ncbi:MAG: sigma-70 family RNA polymerase sigma factor [Saprospiraceae bacterium]|nr:sigma-70 family RNA polymerase sigma factor [Saprospiraceae bacterium]
MDKTSYLIKQIKSGDHKAFEELYKDYSGAVYGVILKMVKNQDTASDILQDVFTKAWKKINTYNPEKGRFYTWIYRIARNTTINHIRAQKPENLTGDVSVYETRIGSQKLNDETLDLRGKVAQLEQKYREIVELIYFKGFTQKEVQEQLDIPLGTIKTRLRKAIKTLGEVYKDKGIQLLIAFILIWTTNG